MNCKPVEQKSTNTITIEQLMKIENEDHPHLNKKKREEGIQNAFEHLENDYNRQKKGFSEYEVQIQDNREFELTPKLKQSEDTSQTEISKASKIDYTQIGLRLSLTPKKTLTSSPLLPSFTPQIQEQLYYRNGGLGIKAQYQPFSIIESKDQGVFYIILPKSDNWDIMKFAREGQSVIFNEIPFNKNIKYPYTFDEVCQLFPQVMKNADWQKAAISSAPPVEELLIPEMMVRREQWKKKISDWLKTVPNEFLEIIIKVEKESNKYMKLMEDQFDHPTLKSFLETFEKVPSLPQGCILFQGQSSAWYSEFIYLKDLAVNQPFFLHTLNRASTDPNIAMSRGCSDRKSDWSILAIYKVTSDEVKGLPIAQIYREAKNRDIPKLGFLEDKLRGEEVILSPGILYRINAIHQDITYFSYSYPYMKDFINRASKGAKIYEIDLYHDATGKKLEQAQYVRAFT